MYAAQDAGRILTTHTGSLPRPPELAQAFASRETGDGPVPPAGTLTAMITDAVADAVRRQVAAGIDVISDGEVSKIGYSTYVKERLSGFGGQAGTLALADLNDHPEFTQRALGGLVTQMPSCNGPVRYTGLQALKADLDNFAAAIAGTGRRGFIPAASPGVISVFLRNLHYPTQDAYLQALAEAMATEYRAITDAAFDLQLDCPDLAMGWHLRDTAIELQQFKRQISGHIEALNHAIDGIDPSRIRLHICWGNYEGPHHHDIALREILPIVTRANVGALCFENANPRHGHEWRVFEEITIPESLTLIPGVIDTSSNYIEHPDLVAERITRLAGSSAGTGSSQAPTAASRPSPPSCQFCPPSPGKSSAAWPRAPSGPARPCGPESEGDRHDRQHRQPALTRRPAHR